MEMNGSKSKAVSARKNHKGKPKPQGLRFPQRLREKKKETSPTNPTKSEREDNTHDTKKGSSREGLNSHTKYQPQRRKARDKQPDNKTKTKPEEQATGAIVVPKDLCKAGWGLWATPLSPEESPQGTLIARDQKVLHQGHAPRRRSINIRIKQEFCTPGGMGSALSPLLYT